MLQRSKFKAKGDICFLRNRF